VDRKLSILIDSLKAVFGEVGGSNLAKLVCALDEVTIEVPVAAWSEVALALRDDAALHFESCLDVCGVDYSTYKDAVWEGHRFAAVYHFLSYKHNVRLRVRVFCTDDDFPVVPSVVSVWPGLNWFEREAFDLFGIMFQGHPDLRRILTDYGFVGHPFRKDFPLSGFVEMRYDPEQGRVIYQPVTIDPRETTPRIIREENYGGC
jgi:NADH-quinone oxidoreductase subunit C